MQNKCNCGSRQDACGCQGFVPVNGNWDFNSGCGCNGETRTVRRRSSDCQNCQWEKTSARRSNGRRSGSDCQCERCDDHRQVARCDQNTYIRNMDDCGCEEQECACSRARNTDCDCEKQDCTCNRTRNNDCDCEKQECTCNRTRNNDCGCIKADASTYARSNRNSKVGMVNVEMQEIDEIFASESALRAGTLFPELHKPMNGYCPYDGNCGTCAQAAAFAAWELRLYLNTHPHDKEALALYRKLCKETGDVNYATTFLKDDCCTTGWNWVKNPWPWEYDCQCGD